MWRKFIRPIPTLGGNPAAAAPKPREFPQPGQVKAEVNPAALEGAERSEKILSDTVDAWPAPARDFPDVPADAIAAAQEKPEEYVAFLQEIMPELLEEDEPLILTDPNLPRQSSSRQVRPMPKSRETVTGSQPFRSRPGKLNIPQTLMFFTAAAEGDPNDPAQIDALSEKFELPAEVGRTLLKHFRVPMTVRDHDGVLHGAWEIDPDMEIPPLPDGQKNEIRPLTWRELEQQRLKNRQLKLDNLIAARKALKHRQALGEDEIGYYDGPSEEVPVVKPSWLKDADNQRVFYPNQLQ